MPVRSHIAKPKGATRSRSSLAEKTKNRVAKASAWLNDIRFSPPYRDDTALIPAVAKKIKRLKSGIVSKEGIKPSKIARQIARNKQMTYEGTGY